MSYVEFQTVRSGRAVKPTEAEPRLSSFGGAKLGGTGTLRMLSYFGTVFCKDSRITAPDKTMVV
jgi:hypothetical protein